MSTKLQDKVSFIIICCESGFKQKFLEAGEQVEADLSYHGESKTNDLPNEGLKSMIQMRHETSNNQLKNWSCMQNNFWHGIDVHCDCMYAIDVLTQLSIENSHPLFNVALVIAH